MARLELEFVQQRFVPWSGLIFLAAALAIAAAGGWQWHIRTDRLENTEQRIDAIKTELDDARRAEEKIAASPGEDERKKNEARVAAALNYPWNRVFSEVEQPGEEKLAVLAFSHSQIGRQTELNVEALDMPTLVNFVDKLNEENEGKPWYIANYQVQQQNMPVTIKALIVRK